jgi:MSHA pilin protein MshA
MKAMAAMNAMAVREEKGFTLIELVMVIVILGILAAFALPRFADLGGDARSSSLQGLAGSMKSAAAIAHSRQLASGDALGASVTLEGQIATMVNSYPTANTAGIVAAINVDTTNDYQVSTTDAGAEIGGGTITLELQTNCSVKYTAATAAADNTSPLTGIYVVTVTKTGC